MKRLIRSSMWPYNFRYEVHWISPDGKDCLLGANNTLEGANKIARSQAYSIFDSPFETNERKLHFLDNIYIYDNKTDDADLMDIETEEYIDDLMSEIDSRIRRKI